jgi:DNA-binding MarR family transcriptional regulator
MTEDDIRRVVLQVMEAERAKAAEHIDQSVMQTISAILTSFGIEEDERKELRADFAHLRKWRRSVETVERVGWTTAVTVIVTGILGALWLGVKTLLGK